MNQPPILPFVFLISNRDFAINFLCSLGYSRADAEDIFSELAKRWVRKPESIPPALTKSMLCHCLRQRAEDLRRCWHAKKRGDGVPNLGDDYLVDVAVEPVELTFDRLPGAITLLSSQLVGATGRRQILLEVMLRGLKEGTSGKHWPDEFTAAERDAFMVGCEDWNDRDFRKAVSRCLSEIIKALRAKAQLN